MTTNNTIAVLDGLYKDVYGPNGVEQVIPDHLFVQQVIPYTERGKLGSEFVKPVCLQLEHGVTSAAPEAGAFDIIAPIAGQLKPSKVKAYQKVLRSRISYDAAFQAPGSGQQAFANATDELFKSMNSSIRHRIEIDIFGYGRDGLGIVESTSSNVITITAASHSAGVWEQAVGAHLAAFDTNAISGATMRSLANGSGTDTYCVVQSVDSANRQITVDDDTNIAAGDYLYFRSDRTATAYNTMLGLKQICSSGTLFNIDNSTYPIFKGNTYSVGSTDLSTEKLLKAWGQAADKGFKGEAKGWVSQVTFANLMHDQSALRRFDKADSSVAYEVGADSLKLHMSNGSLELRAHSMVKQGEGYIVVPSKFMRSGPTDVTFNRAKMVAGLDVPDSFFRELTDNAGYEIRLYESQYIWTGQPNKAVILLSNITNS